MGKLSYYDTYGKRKPPFILTYNEVVEESRKKLKKEYKTELGKIAILTKILEEDDKCWVDIEGQNGHWTKLPSNRTLANHWHDQTELEDLKKGEWKNFLDFQTPLAELSLKQYYLFLVYSEYHFEKSCRTCHSELQTNEKFLWLPDMFECDGFGDGIQLCQHCLHSFLESM